MSALRLASRYAKSLKDLAIEQKVLEEVAGNIKTFNSMVTKNRDLLLLLKSPIVQPSKKATIIKKITRGSFHEMTSRFIDIVIRKRREAYLPEIVNEFLTQYKIHKQIATAKLTTAAPVNAALLQTVKGIVLAHTGQKEVELETAVDPSLIGGFILQFGDKLFDSSLSHKLDKLSKTFAKNKYVREF